MQAPVAAADHAPVRFHRLAPIPPSYPKPWFPMLPVLGKAGRASEPFSPASRFLADDTVHTASGAAAIYWALRSAGIGRGDRVAIPAYHCPTMVFPVLAAGAIPRFVELLDDLSLVPDAIARACEGAPRAVLLPHFFGFRQSGLSAIREWCDANDAVLIEDCAHAFYGEEHSFVPGQAGHYAIASTRKFFAGTEGGALVANGIELRLDLSRPPWLEDARALVDTMHMGLRAGTFLWPRRAAPAAEHAQRDGPPDLEAARKEAAAQSATAGELAASMVSRRALRSATALIRCADHARSAAVRRARYRRWHDTVARTPGVSAFRAELPDSGVPYAYAALLERPDSQFAALKYGGVQVWRWDRLAISGCEISRRMALELIQLPCQQSLSDERFDELLRAFERSLSST